MSNETKHMPLPWRYQSETEHGFSALQTKTEFQIYTAAGKFGNPATCESEADAELIVRAVNSHEALVAACEAALAFAALVSERSKDKSLVSESGDIAGIIQFALNEAKAKGGAA